MKNREMEKQKKRKKRFCEVKKKVGIKFGVSDTYLLPQALPLPKLREVERKTPSLIKFSSPVQQCQKTKPTKVLLPPQPSWKSHPFT